MLFGALTVGACTTSTEVGQFDPATQGDPGGQNGDGSGQTSETGGSSSGGAGEPGTPTPVPPGTALLRVLHVSQQVGAIDLCLVSPKGTVGPLYGGIGRPNGTSIFVNLGYLEVPSGSYEIRVIGAGLPCTQKALMTSKGTVTFGDGTHSTVVVYGNYALSQGARGPEVAALSDDLTPDSQKRKVRFIHAAPEYAGTLDLEWKVQSASSYDVVFEGAPYGGVATTSQYGAVSKEGYTPIYISSLVNQTLLFRVEGVSTAQLPAMRSIVQQLTIPKANNFTVLVLGYDPTGSMQNPDKTSFVICDDADTRATKSASPWCTLSRQP